MSISTKDKVISVLSYFTFGLFALIWLVYVNVAQKSMTKFLMFNIYQSIFLSVLLCIMSYIYSIAINLMSVIPVIGKIAIAFNVFFNATPIYSTFTISGFLVVCLAGYLSFLAIMGKKSFIPYISKIVEINIGV